MKGIKTILGALAAASLLFSVSAYAQDSSADKGPYLTNSWSDNIFVGGGLGLNSGIRQLSTFDIMAGGINVDLFAGKWFTPEWGARIGVSGVNTLWIHPSNPIFSNGQYKVDLHGDLMWAFLNTFQGYKEDRKWNPAAYITTGLLIVGGDKEFPLGVGIYSPFTINEKWDWFIDANVKATHRSQFSANTVGGVAFPMNLTFGVAYKIGKTNFDSKSSVVPAVVPVPFTTEQYEDLSGKVAELEKENADLKNKIADLEKENADLKDKLASGNNYVYDNGEFVAVEPTATALTVYFDCGSSTISAREKAHLEYFTDKVVNADTKVAVNGYADKQTGSAKRNQQLSEQRVKAVVDLLKKAGASESNIESAAHGSSVQPFEGAAKNRVVTIELK